MAEGDGGDELPSVDHVILLVSNSFFIHLLKLGGIKLAGIVGMNYYCVFNNSLPRIDTNIRKIIPHKISLDL